MLLLMMACLEKLPDAGILPTGSLPNPGHHPHDTDGIANRNVLVLIMDGVRTQDFSLTTESDITGQTGEETAANTWQRLGKAGTAVRTILNPGITVTASSHAALITGRINLYGNMAEGTNGPSLYRPEYPTFFQELKSQLGLDETQARFIGNTQLLEDVSGSLYPGLAEAGVSYEALMDGAAPESDDAKVFTRLQQIISTDQPRLLVANIHNVDRMGHFNPDQYGPNVELIDRSMGNFWDWLSTEESDYLANTLVILTTDHGRHSVDLGFDPYWQEHGDSCTGCRELPLFLMGSGIEAGRVVEPDDSPWTQQDVSVLISGWLGIDMPFAQGLPMDDLVSGLAMTTRQGDVEVSGTTALQARRHWLNNLEHRSEIRVGDAVVSDPEAFDVAAPALFSAATATYVCWRELHRTPVDDLMPWITRCLMKEGDGAWNDIGFPEDNVGVGFKPVFVEKNGVLYVAYVNNPNSIASEGSEANALGVAVTTFHDGQWSTPQHQISAFAMDVAMDVDDVGQIWLTAAYSGAVQSARYARQIGVMRLGIDPDWEPFSLADVLPNSPRRAEHPAIRVDGSTVQMAALGWDDNQSIVAFWQSTDGGRNWSSVSALPQAGTPFPELSPQWDGPFLVWAALSDDPNMAQLCRMVPGQDSAATCIALQSPRVDAFTVADGQVMASVDNGVSDWVIRSYHWGQ